MNSSCQTPGSLKAGVFWLKTALGRGERCPVWAAVGAGPQRILTYIHVLAIYADFQHVWWLLSFFSITFCKNNKVRVGKCWINWKIRSTPDFSECRWPDLLFLWHPVLLSVYILLSAHSPAPFLPLEVENLI